MRTEKRMHLQANKNVLQRSCSTIIGLHRAKQNLKSTSLNSFIGISEHALHRQCSMKTYELRHYWDENEQK